jgi:hypothetical protein
MVVILVWETDILQANYVALFFVWKLP